MIMFPKLFFSTSYTIYKLKPMDSIGFAISIYRDGRDGRDVDFAIIY